MGLICTCGVRTNPVAITNSATFIFPEADTATGPATYRADACADRLESSSFSIVFVDTDNEGLNRSFSFASTSIQQVTCAEVAGQCEITLFGMGLVTGELTPRQFLVIFRPNVNVVRFLTIQEFASQTEVAIVTPGSITGFGCP